MGFGYQTQGDLKSAIESFQSALLTSKDPLYGQGAEVLLGHCYILSSQYDKAEELLRDGSDFYRRFGNGMTGVPADLGLGAVLISQGRMTEGLNKIKDARRILSENQRRGFYIVAEYMLGKITFDDQIKAGKAKLVGDRKPYEQLKSILVQFTPDFEILPGTKTEPSKSDKAPFEQNPPAWTDGG
jgi:tetratricopeptide (TPR) repeat protein